MPVILIVDDDAGDQILIEEALQSRKLSHRIHIAGDGEEALEYLFHSGRHCAAEHAPRPDLVLLDLNMPRLGGKEVLARLKADPLLKTVPVVVFSTSARDEDVRDCYALGANSYVQKPTDFEQFQAVLQSVEHFWLTVCRRAPPH